MNFKNLKMLFSVSASPKLTTGTKNHYEIFYVSLPLIQSAISTYGIILILDNLVLIIKVF